LGYIRTLSYTAYRQVQIREKSLEKLHQKYYNVDADNKKNTMVYVYLYIIDSCIKREELRFLPL